MTIHIHPAAELAAAAIAEFTLRLVKVGEAMDAVIAARRGGRRRRQSDDEPSEAIDQSRTWKYASQNEGEDIEGDELDRGEISDAVLRYVIDWADNHQAGLFQDWSGATAAAGKAFIPMIADKIESLAERVALELSPKPNPAYACSISRKTIKELECWNGGPHQPGQR